MSETAVPQQSANEIKPSIKKALPNAGALGMRDSIQSLVASNERAFGLGRFNKSEKVGVIGDVENISTFLATELGLTQDSKELQALENFLKKKGSKEAFQLVADREMTGKTPEEQAKFMSAGMENLKEMVDSLMRIKSEAKSSPEMEAELDELWNGFLNGSEADRAAIRGFIKEANKAKREAWTSLKELHRSQEDLDKANKFRSRADRAKSSKDPDKYRFTSMSGGPIRKTLSWLSRAPGAVWDRLAGLPHSTDVNDENYEMSLSVELRAKILASGDSGRILDMWRDGVLSTNELGALRKQLVADMASDSISNPLTPEEADALNSNKELDKYQKDGVFISVGRDVQAKHFQEHFQQKQDLALEHYTSAQDRYLGFSFDNAPNWQKVLGAAAVNADLVLPEWFKEFAIPKVDTFRKGVLTLGEDIGKEVGFVVDNMEGMIAGSALEDLGSTVVAREMAVDQLVSLLSSQDGETNPKDLVKAAEVLRGAEAALARTAMMVARAVDTVSITDGKNLALSVVLSPVELAEAGLDAATGGIMFRENTLKILKDLKERTKRLLDGNGALKDATAEIASGKSGQELAQLAQRAVQAEQEWFDDRVSEAKIPDQYLNRDGMNEYLNGNIFSKMAESLRKVLGPDTPLAQRSQAWRTLTIGSRRQSVDEVVKATSARRGEATVAVEALKEKLVATEGSSHERSDMATAEATLISLREAQRNFTLAELKQISERAKLDSMWRDVFAVGAGAATVALAATAVAGLDAIAGRWADIAGEHLTKVTEELRVMKDGMVEIARIAKEAGLPTAEMGGNFDVWFKQAVEVLPAELNLNAAEAARDYSPGVRTVLTAALKAAPILAVLRSSWNLIPGKARAFTDLMQSSKIEKVNVI